MNTSIEKKKINYDNPAVKATITILPFYKLSLAQKKSKQNSAVKTENKIGSSVLN